MEFFEMILLTAAVLSLLLGFVLLSRSQQRRRRLGLPNGDVFYQDHSGQPMAAVTLRSSAYGIHGKPDCLIRNADGIIPVEFKKSAKPPAGGGVYPNHLIQVLAYIVLVRENYREPVPYGLVIYSGETARKVIPTAENLSWLAEVVEQVRSARGANAPDRSHSQQSRCRGCGLKQSCDQSLWMDQRVRS
jgi:CRISPR/Cas system-associated exonuclease Cas4 (RecB family)